MADDDRQDDVADETTVSMTDYKNLQRKLSKVQAQNVELTRENVDASRALAATSRIEAVLEKQLETDGEDDTLTELQERRKADNEVFQYRSELIAVMQEHDTDFNDEKLKEAKALWDAGKGEEAVAEARKAMGTADPTDLQAMVAAEVAKLRRAGAAGADTGDSTGPSAGASGLTREDLGSIAKPNQSSKEIVQAAKEALDKLYKT